LQPHFAGLTGDTVALAVTGGSFPVAISAMKKARLNDPFRKAL